MTRGGRSAFTAVSSQHVHAATSKGPVRKRARSGQLPVCPWGHAQEWRANNGIIGRQGPPRTRPAERRAGTG